MPTIEELAEELAILRTRLEASESTLNTANTTRRGRMPASRAASRSDPTAYTIRPAAIHRITIKKPTNTISASQDVPIRPRIACARWVWRIPEMTLMPMNFEAA